MRGRFDEALERLEDVDQEPLRTLKVYQYWSTYIGLLKLRRAIHRSVKLSSIYVAAVLNFTIQTQR